MKSSHAPIPLDQPLLVALYFLFSDLIEVTASTPVVRSDFFDNENILVVAV